MSGFLASIAGEPRHFLRMPPDRASRSIAMLPAGAPALNRDEALEVLTQLAEALRSCGAETPPDTYAGAFVCRTFANASATRPRHPILGTAQCSAERSSTRRCITVGGEFPQRSSAEPGNGVLGRQN